MTGQKKIAFAIFSIVCASFSTVIQADDAWHIFGSAGLTTNYVYRGISYTEDKVTPRANLYIGHESGLFLSTYFTRHNLGGLFQNSEPRDSEFEFNFGYYRQINDLWALSFSHAWQEFDQIQQSVDYDYREYRLNAHYSDWLSFFVGYTDSVWNTVNKLTTYSVTGRHAIPFNILAEVEVGWLDFESGAPVDFPFLRTSFGKSIADNWTAAIEYTYSDTRANTFLDSDRVGSNVSGVLTYHFQIK